jgi:hypothetical protein
MRQKAVFHACGASYQAELNDLRQTYCLIDVFHASLRQSNNR